MDVIGRAGVVDSEVVSRMYDGFALFAFHRRLSETESEPASDAVVDF